MNQDLIASTQDRLLVKFYDERMKSSVANGDVGTHEVIGRYTRHV